MKYGWILDLLPQLRLPWQGLQGQPVLPAHRGGRVLHRPRGGTVPHQEPDAAALPQAHRVCPLVSELERNSCRLSITLTAAHTHSDTWAPQQWLPGQPGVLILCCVTSGWPDYAEQRSFQWSRWNSAFMQNMRAKNEEREGKSMGEVEIQRKRHIGQIVRTCETTERDRERVGHFNLLLTWHDRKLGLVINFFHFLRKLGIFKIYSFFNLNLKRKKNSWWSWHTTLWRPVGQETPTPVPNGWNSCYDWCDGLSHPTKFKIILHIKLTSYIYTYIYNEIYIF